MGSANRFSKCPEVHSQGNQATTDAGGVYKQVQKEEPNHTNLAREANLQMSLDEELKKEESLWMAKSRFQKILEGDHNTSFFHLTATVRRRRNAIDCIKNNEGVWIKGTKQIGNCFNEHFLSISTSFNPSFPLDLENLFQPVLSEADHEMLCAILSDSKIGMILRNLGTTKAPGPDGMTSVFYKFYWSTMKSDVINSVKSFFIGRHLLKEQNHTHVALIPKLENSSSVNHFCPISLCNTSYKLISKILASCLQFVLNKLISPLQAAFVPNRMISDNIFMVQELWHTMRHKKGKSGLMAIKLNMEKAYDKME
ncbi:hypothetical protein RJ639_011795 [Escallonia herrerae]|uniref:Reverse transcriptase n=1 Tax=Escallonia herrerae TaxID=1293975 RepID=A0AA89AQ78_9ASTE|nr:hypothetical protein RJ639_011795 [Escallonia herrerae]